jgi:Transposase IS4
MTNEICDIIIRQSNRKGREVCAAFNKKLKEKYPDATKRPPPCGFVPFTALELDAFLGILIAAGVHRSNKEHLDEMWQPDALPIYRAALSRDRFKMFLRFIRFDNAATRNERLKESKAAAISEIWNMLNSNLSSAYKPSECITVDEQLFPYRGRTRFTQYLPSKPAKYGIKIFWACDALNAYPLKGIIYTGKSQDGVRQQNVGERMVLELVSLYKGSGRNITTDNFFTSLNLAENLLANNITLVGTVRKNKRFLPINMLPNKTRSILTTNFAFRKNLTLCSYVMKKNKAVIMLSSMHLTPQIEESADHKLDIIKYYNKTKGGVDTMDKMLQEYSVKRKTHRWPLAFFYNMVNIAGLASYVLYVEQKKNTKTNERRKFLKELALELCKTSIEERASNPQCTKRHFTKVAMESCLGKEIGNLSLGGSQPTRNPAGHAIVVGSCYVCRQLHRKQRKTRKSCKICRQPICDEHSTQTATCNPCLTD